MGLLSVALRLPGPFVLCRQGRTRWRTLEASVLTAGQQLALPSVAVHVFVSHPNGGALPSIHSTASVLGAASGLVLSPADPLPISSFWICAASGRARRPQRPKHFCGWFSLWLLLSGSCAGPSTHPPRSGVSQGSVVCSLEEPIRADGFKELRADSQPQHPSRSSEPQFRCTWCHPLQPAFSGYLPWPQDHSGA